MSTKQHGFTLVEVLIIAPIVILFIGAFIALLVSLTGESLVTREKAVAVYETQAALDNIEASASRATSFLTTTGALTTPQGRYDDTVNPPTANNTPFTNSATGNYQTLIMSSAATTKGPYDSTRQLIYAGASPCDSKNALFTYQTVYFIAADTDTADTSDKALFKRTIVPQTSACAVAWQRNSCNAAHTATYSTLCKANDEKLASGVANFAITYYTGSSSTAISASNASSATDVSINLLLSKPIAGTTTQYSGTVRVSSANIQTSG